MLGKELPSPEQAYMEALNNLGKSKSKQSWSHHAVLFAAERVGINLLRKRNGESMEKFSRYYSQAVEFVSLRRK